jgi:methylated-DNA-[protein]-cysteine S-methyltransferase
MNYFDGMSTPIGRIHIVVSDKALTHIYFPTDTWTEEYVRKPKHPLILAAKKQLTEYFKGDRKTFGLPLNPVGTAFQKRAWNVLRKIPYGKTISYSEEAKRMKHPLSVRAAGSANGKNPLPIIVPCHRVVAKSFVATNDRPIRSGGFRAKNGTLGGYSGGLSCKQFLLRLEAGK